MGLKKYDIVYGIRTTQVRVRSENGLFFLGQVRTFIPLLSAVNLTRILLPGNTRLLSHLQTPNPRMPRSYGHHPRRGWNRIRWLCPYSFQQEIVHDVILTRIVRMRTFCGLRVERTEEL
jgi:hypothetical protein